MANYVAHYKTLDASSSHITGLFEFESNAKINSKKNSHDARLAMLEKFGNNALSWQIMHIEKKKISKARINGQLALDFRGPAKKKRKVQRKYM